MISVYHLHVPWGTPRIVSLARKLSQLKLKVECLLEHLFAELLIQWLSCTEKVCLCRNQWGVTIFTSLVTLLFVELRIVYHSYVNWESWAITYFFQYAEETSKKAFLSFVSRPRIFTPIKIKWIMQNETQNSEEKILKLWSVSFYSSYNALWRFKKKKKKLACMAVFVSFLSFYKNKLRTGMDRNFIY